MKKEKAAEDIRRSFYEEIAICGTASLKNFFESVRTSRKSVLQDMLRIIKIMTEFNDDLIERESSNSIQENTVAEMRNIIEKDSFECDLECWLKVSLKKKYLTFSRSIF